MCITSQKVQLLGPIFETEWSKGSNCASAPNFVAIGTTIADIWGFFDFSRWRAAAILDFSNFIFLTVGRLKRAELRHRAKFVDILESVRDRGSDDERLIEN